MQFVDKIPSVLCVKARSGYRRTHDCIHRQCITCILTRYQDLKRIFKGRMRPGS